jgi:hypothetical protein
MAERGVPHRGIALQRLLASAVAAPPRPPSAQKTVYLLLPSDQFYVRWHWILVLTDIGKFTLSRPRLCQSDMLMLLMMYVADREGLNCPRRRRRLLQRSSGGFDYVKGCKIDPGFAFTNGPKRSAPYHLREQTQVLPCHAWVRLAFGTVWY